MGDIGSTAAVLPVQGIITSASKQGGYSGSWEGTLVTINWADPGFNVIP